MQTAIQYRKLGGKSIVKKGTYLTYELHRILAKFVDLDK